MTLFDKVVFRLREGLNKWQFQRVLPCIRLTPPIMLGKTPFTLLSMVHHRDVDAYLLAAKSFAAALSPRRIVVVTDPSITEQDCRLLAEHIRGIEFIAAKDSRDQALPQGGCWERLIAISNAVDSDYVVQLDADTVTLDRLSEVSECIREGKSFVLATEDGQDFRTCQTAAKWSRDLLGVSQHIQLVAESVMDQLPDMEILKYVRGCAGFSGFAKNSFDTPKLVEFSQRMQHMLGVRWAEWGSEQVTSNFMVANARAARVLPHPKYCHPLKEKPGTVFLHFAGFVRYQTPRYAQVARQVCNNLRQTQAGDS